MSLHPVATIRDMSHLDIERSIVTVVWLAREVISGAATVDGESKLMALTKGREFARSAISLASYNVEYGPIQAHMEACEQALSAAEAQWRAGRILTKLTGFSGVPDHDRLAEVEQMKRCDRSVSDAIKLAKSECHRALARAVESYPKAFVSEGGDSW